MEHDTTSPRRPSSFGLLIGLYGLYGLLLALAGLLVSACSASHAPPVAGPSSPLASCLERGGALVELQRVDNNDSADHGALVTLAISESSQIAAAAADGTIKFWDLETGLLGTATSAVLVYGPEIDGAEVRDLAYLGDRVLAGDRRGVVTEWEREASFRIVGGTTPDISIVAVAGDGAGRIAHADEQPGGNVMVRALEGSESFGPLTTGLAQVHDLLFLSDGRLVLGGADAAGNALVEIRDAADPSALESSLSLGDRGAVLELTATADGARIAASGAGFVALLDPSPAPLASAPLSEEGYTSVALSQHGRVLFLARRDLFATERGGELRAFLAGDEGLIELTSFPLPDPVAVRAAADGEHLIVGSADGTIRLLGCAE